jgi:thioredoxin reductase (NADPH)
VINLRIAGQHRILIFSNGTEIVSRTVVLALGATYQWLGIPALEELIGAGIYYGGGITEAPSMADQHVFVAGAGNSAGQAAVNLARYAKQVTIVACDSWRRRNRYPVRTSIPCPEESSERVAAR